MFEYQGIWFNFPSSILQQKVSSLGCSPVVFSMVAQLKSSHTQCWGQILFFMNQTSFDSFLLHWHPTTGKTTFRSCSKPISLHLLPLSPPLCHLLLFLKEPPSNVLTVCNCCRFHVVGEEIIATQHFCPQDRCGCSQGARHTMAPATAAEWMKEKVGCGRETHTKTHWT